MAVVIPAAHIFHKFCGNFGVRRSFHAMQVCRSVHTVQDFDRTVGDPLQIAIEKRRHIFVIRFLGRQRNVEIDDPDAITVFVFHAIDKELVFADMAVEPGLACVRIDTVRFVQVSQQVIDAARLIGAD